MPDFRLVVSVSAAWALVGAFVSAGCSSSSSPAASTNNTPDTGTTGSDAMGAGDDGGGGGGDDAAAMTCTPMFGSATPLTYDAGALSAEWACYEGKCQASLAACGTDCACNNAVITALNCTVAGGSASTCFGPVATSGSAGAAVITCTTPNGACMSVDGGGAGGGGTDGGGASDASMDSGAVDAPSGG